MAATETACFMRLDGESHLLYVMELPVFLVRALLTDCQLDQAFSPC
jgi:hypothetical protein